MCSLLCYQSMAKLYYFRDNIWIYIKSITDLYRNDNNLSDGISKDLVYQALNSLGFKLYNSESDADNETYLSGQYLGTSSEYSS